MSTIIGSASNEKDQDNSKTTNVTSDGKKNEKVPVKVVILPGIGALNPEINCWYGQLADRLKQDQIPYVLEQLPDPLWARDEFVIPWLKQRSDEDTILIGHCSGARSILQFLLTYPKQFRRALLVAPCVASIPPHPNCDRQYGYTAQYWNYVAEQNVINQTTENVSKTWGGKFTHDASSKIWILASPGDIRIPFAVQKQIAKEINLPENQLMIADPSCDHFIKPTQALWDAIHTVLSVVVRSSEQKSNVTADDDTSSTMLRVGQLYCVSHILSKTLEELSNIATSSNLSNPSSHTSAPARCVQPNTTPTSCSRAKAVQLHESGNTKSPISKKPTLLQHTRFNIHSDIIPPGCQYPSIPRYYVASAGGFVIGDIIHLEGLDAKHWKIFEIYGPTGVCDDNKYSAGITTDLTSQYKTLCYEIQQVTIDKCVLCPCYQRTKYNIPPCKHKALIHKTECEPYDGWNFIPSTTTTTPKSTTFEKPIINYHEMAKEQTMELVSLNKRVNEQLANQKLHPVEACSELDPKFYSMDCTVSARWVDVPESYDGPSEFTRISTAVSHGVARDRKFLNDTAYTRWRNAVSKQRNQSHPLFVSTKPFLRRPILYHIHEEEKKQLDFWFAEIERVVTTANFPDVLQKELLGAPPNLIQIMNEAFKLYCKADLMRHVWETKLSLADTMDLALICCSTIPHPLRFCIRRVLEKSTGFEFVVLHKTDPKFLLKPLSYPIDHNL